MPATPIRKKHKIQWIQDKTATMRQKTQASVYPLTEKVDSLIYRAIVSEENEALMRKLPESFMRREGVIIFSSSSNRNYAYRCRITDRPMPATHSVLNLAERDLDVHPDQKMVNQIRYLMDEITRQEKESEQKIREFESQAWSLLAPLNTLNQLRTAWPEIVDEFVDLNKIISRAATEKRKNEKAKVPVNMDDLNKALRDLKTYPDDEDDNEEGIDSAAGVMKATGAI